MPSPSSREDFRPPLSDKFAHTEYTKLESLLSSRDFKSARDFKDSRPDTAHKFLPPLKITSGSGKPVYEGKGAGERLRSYTYPAGNLGEITWRRKGNSWVEEIKNKAGLKAEHDSADSVRLVAGDLVIERANETNIRRRDGSTAHERIGINGSHHIVYRDPAGKATKAVHNSTEYFIKGKAVFDKTGRHLPDFDFDDSAGKSEISYKRLGLKVTLKDDGTTEALSTTKNGKTHGILAFGNKSRVYTDTEGKLVRLRMEGGVCADVVTERSSGRRTLEVKHRDGKPLREHPLNGAPADSVDPKTGMTWYKVTAAKSYELDRGTSGLYEARFLDHRCTGFLRLHGGTKHERTKPIYYIDSAGKTYDITYKDTDPQAVKSIKEPYSGRLIYNAETRDLRGRLIYTSRYTPPTFDDERGLIKLATTDGKTRVTYDLAERTRTTTTEKSADRRSVLGDWLTHRDYRSGPLAGGSVTIDHKTFRGDVASIPVKDANGKKCEHAMLESYEAHKGNGRKVTISKSEKGDETVYTLTNKAGTWKFADCSVDKNGVVHLRDLLDKNGKPRGGYWVVDALNPGTLNRLRPPSPAKK
jgi:hypothetical protein